MLELVAHDFVAIEISRNAQAVEYEVRGQVRCPTTGYRIELEPTNEGIVPTPESALLKMVVIKPSGIVHETVTETDVSYHGRDGHELKTVGIRLGSVVDENGSNSISLPLNEGR